LLVTDVREPCSDGLVAVQVTPGRAAPDESVTVPVMSPVVWANARLPAAAATMAIAASSTGYLRNLIDFLLCFSDAKDPLYTKRTNQGTKPAQPGTTQCPPEQSNCQSGMYGGEL
jgi:hypothetical protein